MSHARGDRATQLAKKVGRSPRRHRLAATDSSRSATVIDVNATLSAKNDGRAGHRGGEIGDWKTIRIRATSNDRSSRARRASLGGRVPRGSPGCRTTGSRAESSRSSVVPIKATQPAAVGPPRLIAATRVAIDVLIKEPLGICTGSADARSVIPSRTQYQRATSTCESSNHPRAIRVVDGNHKTRHRQCNRTDGNEPGDVGLEATRHQPSGRFRQTAGRMYRADLRRPVWDLST